MFCTFVIKVQNLSLRDSRVLCTYRACNNFTTSIVNGTMLTVCQLINPYSESVPMWQDMKRSTAIVRSYGRSKLIT